MSMTDQVAKQRTIFRLATAIIRDTRRIHDHLVATHDFLQYDISVSVDGDMGSNREVARVSRHRHRP